MTETMSCLAERESDLFLLFVVSLLPDTAKRQNSLELQLFHPNQGYLFIRNDEGKVEI